MSPIFFSLFACLAFISCVQKVPASTEQWAASARNATAPILWTADYSPDGRFYAVGGNDSLLKVYRADDYQLLHSFRLPASVQCLDWHKDSRLLAITVHEKSARLLDMNTTTFQELGKGTGSRALDWNSEGTLLVVGDYENTLQIWSKNGQLLKTIEKSDNKSYLSVEWHPTEPIMLAVGDKIRLFDTSGRVLKSIKHRQEETAILTARWHPGGAFFAVGDYGEPENGIESLLQFWDTSGVLIKTVRGSKAEYRNLRWNRTGNVLATASDALRLWSDTGELIHSGHSEDMLWGIDWDHQGASIVTSSMKGKIRLWSEKAKLTKVVEW